MSDAITTRRVSLYELFQSVGGRFAAEKAAKAAKAAATTRLETNVNIMLAEGRLWTSLADATMQSIGSDGLIVRQYVVDSLYDRFDGGTYTGFKDRRAFCSAVVRQVSAVVALTFANMVADAKEKGKPGADAVSFDPADATDRKIAVHVFSESFGIGTKLSPASGGSKVSSERIIVARNEAKRLADMLEW